MRFDLTTLRLFVAVVEERSIAKAAEREHLVASAVSKRIGDLEEQLGMPLLVRLHAGVNPTPAGEALERHAREILKALDRIPRELSRFAGEASAPIRIAANFTATVSYLVEDLKTYLAANPAVKVRVDERHSLLIIDAVVDGRVDFGIVGHYRPVDRLRVIPYRRVPLWLAVPPTHPLAERESITFAEVLEFELITLTDGAAIHAMALDAAAEARRTPKFSMQVTNYEAMRTMVQANLGAAVIPEPNLLPFKDLLGLCCIPLVDRWASMQLNLLLPEDEPAPAVRHLVSYLTAA
jgi:DNA-binding transcriptional LysR family regulator